jgi:hypothetical protein
MDGNNVNRNWTYLLSVAACGALLASCGGGTPTPTPTPTPTSTVTPTPTPSATPLSFSFTQPFSVGSGALYIYGNFTPTGGTEVFNDASRVSAGSGGVAFEVSPEKATFGFPDLSAAAEFLGTNRTSATAQLRSYAIADRTLNLEVPFTNVLRATYARNDSFVSGTTPGILRSNRVLMVAIPVTTTAAITGTSTYTGQPHVVGGTKGATAPGSTSAAPVTFTITVNTAVTPNTTTITGTIPVSELVSGTPTVRANLAFSATVGASNIFTGTVTDTANGFTGTFGGSLAGPNREEVFLLFAASHTDGRKYVGSLIAD